jgi:ABC-type transport system substrate-binding protein
VATPISDIGMIFITDKKPMLDKNVRLAAIMAIHKKAIVDRLLHGYDVPIETLEAPNHSEFDPRSRRPTIPRKPWSCSSPEAIRRRSRSSSPSRQPAASSRKITR